MSVNESLAQTSNLLVYSSMAVYAFALVGSTASLAAGRGARPGGDRRRWGRGDVRPDAGRVGGHHGPAHRVQRRDTQLPPLPPGRWAGNIAMALTWLATLLLGGAVLLRGLAVGRPPWGNMYEFSTASALAISAAFLVVSLRRDVRWLGLFVVLPVLLTLGLAVTVLYTEAAQLVPALRSYWLVIHVSLAIICGGALCVGAAPDRAVPGRRHRGAAHRAGPAVPLAPLADRLPAAVRLDALAYRVIAFMFPLWTFTVVAGAIWAENAWGRYWGWDPKETWAFITWVAYAGYLHARATAGWKGRKAAYLALVAFACFIFNYYGVQHLPGRPALLQRPELSPRAQVLLSSLPLARR